MLELLQPKFSLKTADHWLTELDRRGVPCSPINDYPQILDNEHVKHLQLVQPLELPNGVETLTTAFPVTISDIKISVRKPPPELGSHNTEVADEWLAAESES